MNTEKLIADLKELENDYRGDETEEDSFWVQHGGCPDNSRNQRLLDEEMKYHYSIFNTRNEYKRTEINVEKIQIDIINNLIFFLKLLKKKNDEEIIRQIIKCIQVSFETENEHIEKISEEKSLYIYKQYLLKNKYIFLKILRKIKNKNFYPNIKQIIKDITRDVFSFNREIHNGSSGFETILSLLYELLNKNIKCLFRNMLLSFFLLSLMSRTNNSVDILYTLDSFYKNSNFSIIVPNTCFISPCELSIYNNIIILRSNVKYFINITQDESLLLPYNCYNIVYIDEHLISDNFYLHIYQTLLKDQKYHYLFTDRKLFAHLNFFDVQSNYVKLKSKICDSLNASPVGVAKKQENQIYHDIIKCSQNEEADKSEIQGNHFSSSFLDNIEVSSSSTYNCSDNEIDIKQINDQNRVYCNGLGDLDKQKRNFFYQYLIIEFCS
ncbi:hypothetical protein, conserved [Plasmodium gonderi]|uniref:Uncharacterized protein n=1 Tax=Plasmodium gonderi TaxID=77519 RepID=A0A1Y1JHL4_PLAGO|nr:hypothetical protein, conserved [Plasmodium gonderi]GAW80242.1 hypothetical protein, conserved [Plasmodium gonderi]